MRLTLLIALFTLVVPAMAQQPRREQKPRLLVLTDIGGDPDDQQSLIRLLHYANEFEIEGLIATASGTPGELKEKVTRPDLIREIVEAYGKVQPNLAKHADGYPPASELLSKIKAGNEHRGREAIGDGHDTEGSKWIIATVDRDDPRPLNITVWGGQTDLAQALWRVKHDRRAKGLARFVSRFRVYDINDQDRIFDWVWSEFPGMFYVLAHADPPRDKREGAYRGMYLGGDESLVSREWMENNIRTGHGPLGALYPPRTWTAPNPHSAIKEGDTPSWFYFLPHGINDPAHPEWGGWGGRFTRKQDQLYRDARDRVGEVEDGRTTVSRWRKHFQNDFQARLDWGEAGPFDPNHPPVAVLNGDKTRRIIAITAKPGEKVQLSAAGSTDPDGNAIAARWFVYPEAGTYRGNVKLEQAEGSTSTFIAPPVAEPQTVHVILELSDNGGPELISLRRAIVTIEP
jgi:hypothetical protein